MLHEHGSGVRHVYHRDEHMAAATVVADPVAAVCTPHTPGLTLCEAVPGAPPPTQEEVNTSEWL